MAGRRQIGERLGAVPTDDRGAGSPLNGNLVGGQLFAPNTHTHAGARDVTDASEIALATTARSRCAKFSSHGGGAVLVPQIPSSDYETARELMGIETSEVDSPINRVPRPSRLKSSGQVSHRVRLFGDDPDVLESASRGELGCRGGGRDGIGYGALQRAAGSDSSPPAAIVITIVRQAIAAAATGAAGLLIGLVVAATTDTPLIVCLKFVAQKWLDHMQGAPETLPSADFRTRHDDHFLTRRLAATGRTV
jgi:hypothetical protein